MATGGSTQRSDQTGTKSTPLHDAVNLGKLEKVQELVRSGVDLGTRDGYGHTPLMCAVALGYELIADFLATSMTPNHLHVTDNERYNVLHMMASLRLPWSQVIESISNICPDLLQQRDRTGQRPIDISKHGRRKCKNVYKILKRLGQQQEQKQRKIQQQQHYTAGIAEKEDTPCDITITVVGHNGVGKSCLVRQLKEEKIPQSGPGATDTADVYVNYIGYNPNTGFRQTLHKDGEIETGRRRLRQIIGRQQKEGTTSDQPSVHLQETVEENVTRQQPSCENPISSEVQYEETHPKQFGKHIFSSETNVHKEIPDKQRNFIENIMSTDIEEDGAKTIKGYITIYDFGGEKVFYNTHHCFMSSNMVFVLVFDVAMCLDRHRKREGYERIEFWLRAIATYAIDQAARGKGTPPIILVGSHMDLVSSNREDQKRLFDSVIAQLNENTEIREIIKTHVQEMFPIEHLNVSTGNQNTYLQVWKKIIEVAPLQSQWMKPVPAKWVAFEHQLMRLKNEGTPILTYVDLLEINRELHVPLEENDIIQFLWKLKFFGSFLCFDLYSNTPFIVLRAQWIIDAFKAIITDEKFTTKLTAKQRLEWSDYGKSGILPIKFMRQLWEQVSENEFLDNEDELCIALETLGLLSKPLSVDTEVDYFIVPSMLQTADPEIIGPVLTNPNTVTTVTLCLKFDNPFIPQAIWDKMIASCIHRFQCLRLFGYDDLKFIQRGFVCLSVDCLWNMIINCSGNAMKVTMFKADLDHSIPAGTGIALLNILEFLLQRILELNHQSHLGYELYLHDDYRFSADEKMVKLDDLRDKLRLECYGLKGQSWIDRGDLYVWFQDPDHKERLVHSCNDDVVKGLPKQKLSFKEIGRVSRYIGSTYQMFFTELDCPHVLLEQEMEEHRHLAFRSRITKVFIHLRKTNVDTGFLAVADTMSRHGINPAVLANIQDINRTITFDDKTLPACFLQKCLSAEDASIIAGHVDIKTYFNLFLELGFSPAKVDDFDDRYRHVETREKVKAMIEAYIKDACPTVNTILLAMQECDMDTESLIIALKPS